MNILRMVVAILESDGEERISRSRREYENKMRSKSVQDQSPNVCPLLSEPLVRDEEKNLKKLSEMGREI